MKFGVREICDVVLRAKANQKVGNKMFYTNEPVIYFDTLKTSSMEGAATTVYAQGGRGNARLMAWEGERTVTFTMEDALISPAGFMILSGAGLTTPEDNDDGKIKVHTTQVEKVNTDGTITLEADPYDAAGDNWIYVMKIDENGNPNTEPYLYTRTGDKTISIKGNGYRTEEAPKDGDMVLVDYYVAKTSNIQQINITPDKFGGFYYLEASTLFRDQNGVDMPAEFIIPKCKIQSNFTFTMASSGDPSTFTFTIDAFPDYTRFDKNEKVLASIQIVNSGDSDDELPRESTIGSLTHSVDENGVFYRIGDEGTAADDAATSVTVAQNITYYLINEEEGVPTSVEQGEVDVALAEGVDASTVSLNDMCMHRDGKIYAAVQVKDDKQYVVIDKKAYELGSAIVYGG